MEVHQKSNKVIRKRLEQQSQESPEERTRREELYKMIEKKTEIHQQTITTNKEQVEKHK